MENHAGLVGFNGVEALELPIVEREDDPCCLSAEDICGFGVFGLLSNGQAHIADLIEECDEVRVCGVIKHRSQMGVNQMEEFLLDHDVIGILTYLGVHFDAFRQRPLLIHLIVDFLMVGAILQDIGIWLWVVGGKA